MPNELNRALVPLRVSRNEYAAAHYAYRLTVCVTRDGLRDARNAYAELVRATQGGVPVTLNGTRKELTELKRRFPIMVCATGAILCLLWSFAAPWAAAFPTRPDHYKVTLFGVRHISDMGPSATQTRCGWHQRLDACAPALDRENEYAKLARARYFVFAGLLFTLIGVAVLRVRHIGPWAASPFVAAALATGAAITLVRSNVPTALAAFAGARVDVNGTGMTAAEIAAGLCFLAAVIAAIPAHEKPVTG